MTRDLIPTVVTNKNGIVTTVHRKPDSALKSKVLAPVALGVDKTVYTLRKALTERLKEFVPESYEHLWRKRVIKEAVAANDAIALEQLDKFFHLKGDIFRETLETINLAGVDRADEKAFQLISDFMILSPRHAGAEAIEGYVQLLLDEPERIEEIAHYRNMAAIAGHVPMVDEVLQLMQVPHSPSLHLPGFLAEAVELSDTPVSDYNLVAKAMTNNEPWYTYSYFGHWDRQSMSYVARLIRENKISHDVAKSVLNSRLSPRETTEIAALVSSVSDLIGQGTMGHEPHLRGPNQLHIAHAIEGERAMRTSYGAVTPIETAEELATCVAQLRFTLTINDLKAQRLVNFLDSNTGALDLLRDHGSEQEVRAIVNLFNEREFIDIELAREHLKDQSSVPLNNGWL